MRVESEIKNVKPETLKPDFADEIYVKFHRHLHIFASNNIVVKDDLRMSINQT